MRAICSGVIGELGGFGFGDVGFILKARVEVEGVEFKRLRGRCLL